jgi:alpha-mannosidase
MNWMWGWHETVLLTLETFRTVLRLLEEYPSCTFSQSQASVYEIVENYEPAMLEQIRKLVAEGRWEITASQWVEGDKNLPGGESLMRHLLYTRRYLSELLDIPLSSIDIDFEPDTFGHNANMPEILSQGGVKYYYHCRGSNDHTAYRWSARSGASILVYQEPRWYNSTILPNLAEFVPGFCSEYATDTALAVYGVGDHGGGPTRRDLERIIDMASWPIYPRVEFGTYRQFFESLEDAELPDVEGERNFIFVGCYTSQTRIKMANRLAEAGLNEAERFGSLAATIGALEYPKERLVASWKNTLFSHFHDILPGSGKTETREYALGKFQDTMACALSLKARALGAIAERINTEGLAATPQRTGFHVDTAEGAGVGFRSETYEVSQVGRGSGNERVFVVFNPLPAEREGCVEITVWDWPHGTNVEVVDAGGNTLPHQAVTPKSSSYWGHTFVSVVVRLTVPGIGYTSIVVRYKDTADDGYKNNAHRSELGLVHTQTDPVL